MDCYEFAPGIWMGSYGLFEQSGMGHHNFKLVINCSSTDVFLAHLDSSVTAISSDVIMLSLDPGYTPEKLTDAQRLLVAEFESRLNRVLQNYIGHFYARNPRAHSLIHPMPNGRPFAIARPVLSGRMEPHLFSLNRLIKLLRHIDDSIEVAIVVESHFNLVATGLAMSYLLDHYRLDFGASFRHLALRCPGLAPLNPSYYDDLLVIEAVRHFNSENNSIKRGNTVLTSHCNLKRKTDDEQLQGHKRRGGDDVLYVD